MENNIANEMPITGIILPGDTYVPLIRVSQQPTALETNTTHLGYFTSH
jgi:hypothetical protein